MNHAEIRHILEKEILRLMAYESPFSQAEFHKYCNYLSALHRIECLSALNQEKIFSATYGNLGVFVLEFTKHISPMLNRVGKKITVDSVLHSRTHTIFSPRLTEIALGCMLQCFLRENEYVNIYVFNTVSGIAICAKSKFMHSSKAALPYIRHIAKLHYGRLMCLSCAEYNEIILTFPIPPRFLPIKLLPCSTELCKLCRI